jgi:hypothetical protein
MAISGGNSTRSQGVRFWTAPRTIRLVAHGLDDHAAGHWRAINLGVMGSVTVTSTPAVDRDLVVEGPRTADRADEIDLCWCGRPFLIRLPEFAGGGSP